MFPPNSLLFDAMSQLSATTPHHLRRSRRTVGRPVEAAQLNADAAKLQLPDRATRRNAARVMGVLAGWRDPNNRFVKPNGQHVVVWPHTQQRGSA